MVLQFAIWPTDNDENITSLAEITKLNYDSIKSNSTKTLAVSPEFGGELIS